MRRPALGLTALSLTLASPALAFDCGKARSASEKAICADPAALRSDAAMSEAFGALVAGRTAPEKAQATQGQVRWLRERDNQCSDQKGAGLSACLERVSDSRRAFLLGQPEAGPGASGRLAPWFRYEKGGKARATIDLQLIKFVDPKTPAERAFNAAADKLVGPLDQPETYDPAADHYVYERDMRLVFASPKLISAHMSAYQDVGGAHPGSYTGNVNIDVAAGREAQFDDLLDARGADKVFALCLKAVQAQRKEKLGADAPSDAQDLADLAKNVREATGKLGAWSFEADKVSITYDPYAVGSYAEGAYDCEIPYSVLKPLARPAFPLP